MPILRHVHACAGCEQLTQDCVTFLGSTVIVHIPCCESCQASMNEDVRFCLLVAAASRQQDEGTKLH